MKVARRILGVAALAMMVGVCSSAQLTKGFRGKVLDLSGTPVAGASVVFQDLASAGNRYEVKTDDHGEYIQIGIPYSVKGYEVSVQLPGLPLLSLSIKPKLMDITDLIFDPRRSVGFQGTVKNKKGEPVRDASVTIVNLDDESHPEVVKTDREGVYRKIDLPCSAKGYELTADILGEKPMSRAFTLPSLQGQVAPQQEQGGAPIYQLAILEVGFDFANPAAGSGGGASRSNPAAEAKSLYELGDYEGALIKANEAVADKNIDDKSLQAAKFFKAASLDKMSHTEEAIAAWEDYNTAYPGDVNVLGMLAKLYEAAGNTAKAEAYKKAFAAKGGKITGESYNQGVVALNGGDAQKAETFFLKAIQEDPTDAEAHRELSIAYAQLARYADAIDQLKIYLKMRPNASDAEQWKQAIVALEPLANPKKK